jgi:hypothetical protein
MIFMSSKGTVKVGNVGINYRKYFNKLTNRLSCLNLKFLLSD